MEDLNDKITGGTLTADEWNQVPSEIQNVIEALGIALSAGDLNQLGKAIAGYVANGSFYTDSGVADAYTLSVIGSKQAPTAYTNGMEIQFLVGNTNTGASTVNVAALGVKSIKLEGNALTAQTLIAGQHITARYDGSDFQIVTDLVPPEVTDLDVLSGTRFFAFLSTATGAPVSSVGSYDAVGIQIHSDEQITQFAVVGGGVDQTFFTRTDDSGSFANWINVVLDTGTIDSLTFSDEIMFIGGAGENGSIRKNDTAGRDELLVYSSNIGFGAGSRGAGIILYGNSDSQHSGNCALLTGPDDDGDAHMIVSERGHTTIGGTLFNFVDDGDDEGVLNIKQGATGGPGIFFKEFTTAEGELAVADGENLTLGHWDEAGKSLTPRMEMDADGDWVPTTDTVGNLGDANSRWNTVYAITGSINTSDKREKQDIKVLTAAEKRVAVRIKGIIKSFRWKSAVTDKGDSARIHFGVMAQELAAAFVAEGLDPYRYGMFCYDEWQEEIGTRQTNVGETVEHFVDMQVYEEVDKPKESVVLVNGKHVLKKSTVKTRVKVFTEVDLYDGKGKKIGKHKKLTTEKVSKMKKAEPIFEDYVVREAGNRYGVRYEEVLAFVIAAM